MNSSSNEVRRCRPALGTFVEISARAASENLAHAAVEHAFMAIAEVEARMSFFSPGSDVSRLNQARPGEIITISPLTHLVLAAAEELHRKSQGVFDITIAPELQRWGYLPASRKSERCKPPFGTETDIELLSGHRVRLRKAVRIDLGGIAKGFAVDQAIEALKHHGAQTGTVNAGGDLRTYGTSPSPIHIRHPNAPRTLLPLTLLMDSAIATSAAYFSRKKWRGRQVTPLVNGISRSACADTVSVSVQAPDCMTADALTKVVMAMGGESAGILAAYSATGFIVTRSGEIVSTQSPDAS